MKDKIIEILKNEMYNVCLEEGDILNIIEESDFNDIAEEIVKLFAIPVASVNEVAVCLKPDHVMCFLKQNGLCLEDIDDCEFRQTKL